MGPISRPCKRCKGTGTAIGLLKLRACFWILLYVEGLVTIKKGSGCRRYRECTAVVLEVCCLAWDAELSAS